MEQFASFPRQSRVSAFKPVLAALAEGERLSRERAREALSLILEGAATPAQLGAFLMALRQRGETPEELIGAAQAMRAAMIRVEAPEDAIDIVGTGGDGANTYNISTLAAIIAAAAGVPVAKHGGKAASSRSGATDVLAELGVKVGIDAASAGACLRDAGICFMAAPTHHPALRHAAPVRSELGLRTIFNLLGPLCNPAGVKRQVLGVYAPEWLEPMALALRELGSERAWLLHGSDGLDEATTTGKTHVVALERGGTALLRDSPGRRRPAAGRAARADWRRPRPQRPRVARGPRRRAQRLSRYRGAQRRDRVGCRRRGAGFARGRGAGGGGAGQRRRAREIGAFDAGFE